MVPGARATEVDVIVSDRRPLGFDFVLGMSAIRLLGGALLDSEGYVQFNPFSTPACAGASAVMRIDEKNFVVTYDTTARSWTAAWKWANGNAPEVLQNAKMEYPPAAASRAAYEEELMSWIRNGWLIQHDERKFGPARALIPLMAVVQRNKGKLVGHYPVCGWLRAASAFAKREANRVTERWDEPIHEDRIRAQLSEIANAVKTNDPVHGRSDVSSGKARIWVDVSMLALSVALEVGGSVIEDGTWLRPDEARHINMAELDAVIKGLNLALSWEMKEIELMTDSATVHQWIEDGLSGRTRLQTKAANEILVRRRIETILALVKEYDLNSGDQNTHGLYMVGDAVWVKSRDGRCDTRYDSGVVTRLVSDQAVEINGVPRHVRDIRRRVSFPSPPARPTPNVNDDGDFNGSTTEWNREPQTIMLTTTTDPQPPQPLVTGRSEGEAQVLPRRSTRRHRHRQCQFQDSASSERAAVSECVESSGNASDSHWRKTRKPKTCLQQRMMPARGCLSQKLCLRPQKRKKNEWARQ
ncbi:hypothetical protein D918_08286 [Trichuris suis]|nr:hypothetical protein D918_08286 [Trichuris suis]